jgi:hypothetical protein
MANAKRGRRLLCKERQRTTLKIKAEYGRRVLRQSNLSGLNTDAGIEASSVRKTIQDIDKKICKILTDLKQDSCLGTIRGSHKDRKSLYDDVQFRREWFSHSGSIHNMVLEGGSSVNTKSKIKSDKPSQDFKGF